MMLKYSLGLVLTTIIAVPCAISQAVISPQPPTVKQFLRDHGVEITPESLKAALKNPDGHVRGAAAAELANEKITASVPNLKESLTKENDPFAKQLMGSALFRLSPADGESFMTGQCQDLSGGKSTAIGTARALNQLDREGKTAAACVPTLMVILKDSSEPHHQAEALSTLASYRSKLQDSTVSEAKSYALDFLKGKDLTLQIAALRFLVAEGSQQSLDAVRQAIAVEPNPDHRALLGHVLQTTPH